MARQFQAGQPPASLRGSRGRGIRRSGWQSMPVAQMAPEGQVRLLIYYYRLF